MCRFAVIDHRSRGYNFIYDSHLNLTCLKFAQGFQAASAQAQFYTQRTGAPNDNFRKNICSEDDLRSRIFETFVVKFLACRPLLGFSNIQKMVYLPIFNVFLP